MSQEQKKVEDELDKYSDFFKNMLYPKGQMPAEIECKYLCEVVMAELSRDIYRIARLHGFYDEKRTFGDVISLIHSELSEALEEYRDNKPLCYHSIDSEGQKKPEGIAVEMADVIIRVLDWAGSEGVDIGTILLEKHLYNTVRPFKHGGKKI